jgi:succinate dehydrogenase hydrophobic anchor subunit
MSGNHVRERVGASAGEASFWRWLALVVTGMLLLALVLAHLWSVHYSGYAGSGAFTFDAVAAKLRNPMSRLIDLGLLVLALVHGLVGTQRIIADLGVLGQGSLRVVNVALTALGMLGLVYGWAIYRAFVQ